MGDRLDVAERLAEGRLAVEHTQTYVRACQKLGYEQSDLTSNPSQIRDWYGSEDGLDLHALDRDCTELRAAGDAVTEGLRIQRAQVGELAAAWTGSGGDAALAFLQRHCDQASVLATEVRAAAQRCESLRDNLWCLLDAKVATAIAIDDRTAAQRPTWLAAAAAVTTGAGDRWTAAEIVQEQVKPYVDNDIRNDWVSTMRSSLAGVAASYDMVTDRMAAAPVVYFELPGDLGPGWQPVDPIPPSAPAMAAAPVAPAAAMPPSVAPAAAVPPADPAPTPSPTPPAAAPDFGTALGDIPAMPTGGGDVGGGLSGLGGLGGLASRIVDAMGGLLGSAGDALGGEDPFGKDAFDEDPFHPDDDHDDADDDPDDDAEKSDEPAAADKADGDRKVDTPPPVDAAAPVGAPGEAPPPADTPPPAEAPPPGEASPPAATPAPAAGPPTGGSTPCEIAADQLPQAGQ